MLAPQPVPAATPSADRVKAIQQALFATVDPHLKPPRVVWAILDGARDPSIHRRIAESPGETECLYRDVKDPSLLAAAPWLVALRPDDEWTRDLILDGWGRSWGLFVDAALPIEVLRRHLRGFLKVKDPADRTLVFRYYDPRVWRLFAPTCTADEARQFQGPTFRYLCEGAGGHDLVTYEAGPEGFTLRSIALVS